MTQPGGPEIGGLAINVVVPEHLRWEDTRRGERYRLSSITVRVRPDGHLAVKAYGRPVAGGRGGYTSFAVPERPELRDLVDAAAAEAATTWSRHLGLP